ncbi:MAG: hypothetical protein Q9226_008520, partial [Calogaya cf. arnoldii]
MSSQAYDNCFSNDSNFGNAIYALSQIHFATLDEGKDTKLYQSHRKHVDLLDAIALLFVYKSNGEVVATGLAHEPDTHVIYWARNQPGSANKRESDYLANIQRSFEGLEDTETTLAIVVPMCASKIRSRIKKFHSAFQIAATEPRPSSNNLAPTNKYMVDTTCQAATELRRYLVDSNFIAPTMSLEDLLSTLDAATGGYESMSEAEMIQTVTIAYQLSLNLLGTTISNLVAYNHHYIRKLKKVGAWYRSCFLIQFQLSQQPPTRRKFRIEHVEAPMTPTIGHHGSTLTALNAFASHFQYPQVQKFSDLKAYYPAAVEGQTGIRSMKTVQHCEITLGRALWQRKKDHQLPGDIEIGCSKASCKYCSIYIEYFNACEEDEQKPHNKIVVKGVHEKCVQGWSMPQGNGAMDDAVRMRVFTEIGELMADIVSRVTGPPHKMSDSRSPEDHGIDDRMREFALQKQKNK